MLAYAAIANAFESGLKLLKRYRDEPLLRGKLNEAEPAWGIPAGMYDRIQENIANERNLNLFEEMSAYFERKRETWHSDGVWSENDFIWIDGEIRGSVEYVRQNQDDRHLEWAAVFFNRVKQDAYSPVNAVQAMVGELVGDTRVIARPTFVSVEMIKEYEHLLEPGDIILERRSWLLSNAFLPGFWPHAALYVGRLEDLRELGIAVHPDVRERMESYLALASDGEPHTIIEALEPGVIFNSTTRSMQTDYLAVLRPRLTKQEKAQAVVRAFRHQGKPYDFSFDFFTSDRLVCTELIYRSFQGLVNLDLIRVMGRDTLPAVEIARKFVLERGRPDRERELDLVLFLDGNPATGKAEWADEDAFCDTLKRTREFNE